MKRKIKIIVYLSVLLVFIIGLGFVLNKYIFADIDQSESVIGAEDYLAALKNKTAFDYWNELVKKGSNSGFDKNILANLSSNNNPEDFEAFTRLRARFFNYISDLKGYNIRVPEPPKNTSKITAELAPQQEEKGINLFKNGGFENSQGGLPSDWQDQWKEGGSKSLDKGVKRTGKKSWRFQQKISDGFQGALSDYVKIQEDKTYKFSAWIKTKKRTKILVQWQEFENDQSPSLGQHASYLGLGANSMFETGDNWQKITTMIKPREARAKYIRVKIASFQGTVWWDDLSLINVNSEYLNPFGCLNNNLAKCIDFGSGEEDKAGEIANVEGEISSGAREGEINYRLIPTFGSIEVSIPEFNTDEKGLPKTPMMLEIGYKDTLSYQGKDKADYRERAVVYSKIGYQAKDEFLYGYNALSKPSLECQKARPSKNEPDICYPADKIDYPILKLGDIDDKQWKYAQAPFPRTSLPLIRALNGKFTFKIVMPKSQDFTSSSLPLNYFSLRAISDSDFDRFDDKQRELFGYYQVNFIDRPSDSVSYQDKDLVLYSRDIMRPIYQETIPGPDEVDRDIAAFSTLGEIEPVSFGVYSGTGIDDLTFTFEDLAKGGEKIPKENIDPLEVVYEKRRLMPDDFFSYALVPDRLEELNKVSLKPKSSVRIWARVQIPDNLSGGEYQGTVRVKKNGVERAKINLKVTILPLVLKEPQSISYTWGDPVSTTYANDTEKLFEFYRDYQLTVLMGFRSKDYNFAKTGGRVADVNLDNFQNRISYYQAKGILAKDQPLSLRFFAEDLYKEVYPGFNFSDINLYTKLNNEEYAIPFGKAVKNLIKIADNLNINFIFEITDEPNTVEERIYADRLIKLVKQNGGTTMADLTSKSEDDLGENNIAPYIIPSSSLPLKPLSKSELLDNKIWNLTVQGEAYAANFPNNYGYYTTRDSYLRTPINNRFLHGLLAYKTDAKFIYAYSAAAWWTDPYRDFDLRPNWPLFAGVEPDRIFVYPTTDGRLIPSINAEGLREGIKDAKYITTLENLIASKNKTAYHLSGTLIKADNSAAIYLLEDNKKRPVIAWSVLASQFNPGTVVIISSSEINGYSLGEPIKYQDGTLFRVKDSPAVYVIEDGKKRLIPSIQIFEGMGYNWGSVIIAEDKSIADLHPAGDPISQNNLHPNGTLVKTASSPSIYFLREGKKRLIISPSVFNSRFVSWGRIITISQSEMDSYQAGDNFSYRNGTIFMVSGSPAVYAVESQKKRLITNPVVFERLGYKWGSIIIAENQSIADLLPLGSPIN